MVKLKTKRNKKLLAAGSRRVPKGKGGKKKKTIPRRVLPLFAAAQLSPFDEGVKGIKVPDQATAPSFTALSRDLTGFTTDATYGVSGSVFRYHPTNFRVGVTAASSSSWSFTAAFGNAVNTTNLSSLTASFAALRPVAWGVRLTSRLATTTASGNVHICLVPDLVDGTTWTYPTTLSAMESCVGYRRIPVAELCTNEVVIASKFTDGSAFTYIDPAKADTGAPGIAPASGWMAIMVIVEGPVSTTNIIDTDAIHHWEALAGTGSAMGVFSPSEAAPSSPAAMAATKYLIDKASPVRIVSDVVNDEGFWRAAADTFSAGVKIATGLYNGMELLGALVI